MVFLFDTIKAFLQKETLAHFIETHKHPLQVGSRAIGGRGRACSDLRG
jgi:hypothetical protein